MFLPVAKICTGAGAPWSGFFDLKKLIQFKAHARNSKKNACGAAPRAKQNLRFTHTPKLYDAIAPHSDIAMHHCREAK
jgi:hypothetical protein